jgi:hypothetical protein
MFESATGCSRIRPFRLPQIQSDVLRQLQVVSAELDGFPAPNLKDPRREVITLLRDFNKKVSKHIEGLPPSSSYNPRDPATWGLMHSINEAFERFRLRVHRTAPRFHPWDSQPSPKTLASSEESMIATVSQDDAEGPAFGPLFYADQVLELAKR